MKRQRIEALGVTLAFSVGAVCIALILDLPSVQAYLGLAPLGVVDGYQSGAAYLGIAVLSGLLVDAVRYLGTR